MATQKTSWSNNIWSNHVPLCTFLACCRSAQEQNIILTNWLLMLLEKQTFTSINLIQVLLYYCLSPNFSLTQVWNLLFAQVWKASFSISNLCIKSCLNWQFLMCIVFILPLNTLFSTAIISGANITMLHDSDPSLTPHKDESYFITKPHHIE